MMRLNLQLTMGSFSLTLFGLIGVAFGMNLQSSFEEVKSELNMSIFSNKDFALVLLQDLHSQIGINIINKMELTERKKLKVGIASYAHSTFLCLYLFLLRTLGFSGW